MVNAQEWLDANYPKEERSLTKELNIVNKNLEGGLDLRDFVNLDKLDCSRNKLTNLDLSSSTKLKEIYCYFNKINMIHLTKLDNIRMFDAGHNLLVNLNFSSLNPESLIEFKLHGNNFASENINCFSPFVKLETLFIGSYARERIENNFYNRFYGDLQSFQNMASLKAIDIRVMDIEGDLEYLPKNIEVVNCYSELSYPKVAKIYEKLTLFNYDIRVWREWENRNFTYEQAKEWLDTSMKPNDSDYVWWLKEIKKVNTEWVSNYKNKEKLRKEYEKFLESIAKKTKLNSKLVNQIKEFDHNNLTLKQKLLIDQLIPDKALNCRYKLYGLCKDCKQIKTAYSWCQFCNSSGNLEVDMLMQKTQLGGISGTLEWIPYEQFTSIEKVGEGGFGTVYKAKWTNRTIRNWDSKSSKWKKEYKGDDENYKMVALKNLKNSWGTTDFLREISYHKLITNDWIQEIISYHGISQDPTTKNYVMVMDYIPDGDLRRYLKNNKLEFWEKLERLKFIAWGLDKIHEKKLIHQDFHLGNILSDSQRCYVADLGLCRPVNETDQGKIYGILPYVAPEVLLGKKYTPAADVYSFGIVTYEVLTGLPPYAIYDEKENWYKEVPHDAGLVSEICKGLRPNLNSLVAPQLLKSLIERCWKADPLQRPTANEICYFLEEWFDKVHFYNLESEFYQQYKEVEKEWEFKRIKPTLFYKTHPQAVYTSRLLDFKNLPQPQDSKELNEKFYSKLQGSKDIEFDLRIVEKQLENLEAQEKNNWTTTFLSFTPELIQTWIEHGFTPNQSQEWINVVRPNQHQKILQEPAYYAWLRDTKGYTPEGLLNEGDEWQLREEYQIYRQKQTQLIEKEQALKIAQEKWNSQRTWENWETETGLKNWIEQLQNKIEQIKNELQLQTHIEQPPK